MDLKEIENIVKKKIEAARDAAGLEAVRIEFLGRKGTMTGLFSELAEMKGEERKKAGQELNTLKQYIMTALQQHVKELEGVALGKLAEQEKLDVTLPGTRPPLGHLHITTQAIEEITRIFAQLGFYRMRYPEVDWDYYAFEALNMPKGHPARDEWETYFVGRGTTRNVSLEHIAEQRGNYIEHPKFGKMVLTPHTSNGQVREMERRKPPIRMINLAKCYRRQSDVSHVPMFHQFEGLLIDRNVAVTHLKGTLEYFARVFFGPERRIRLRPFHFRFTEPSFEVDVSCGVCHGTGYVHNPSQPPLTLRGGEKCRLCKSGWLELAGAGMVHPNVLKAGGLDPKVWSGFAFGFGVERSYMMKQGLRIDDIRVLYNNDLNFLEQF
ncbi:phenylalanine--tRNA ligase subunit alpha [Candidatus Uhrbacteria bacterium]|nr:phenylalanine--tRNA ligase subunit alpha [Candidatus Uhrbacteria bacterium]